MARFTAQLSALDAISAGYYIGPPDAEGICDVVSPEGSWYRTTAWSCTCRSFTCVQRQADDRCKHARWVEELWHDQLSHRQSVKLSRETQRRLGL